MPTDISTIFWDVGNVLFSAGHLWYRREGKLEFKPVLKLLGISAKRSEEIWDKYDLERLIVAEITEDEYWQIYIKESPKNPGFKEIKKVYRGCIWCNEELLAIIKGLIGKYDQYLFSNHAIEWLDYLLKNWPLQRYFNDIFCSAWEKKKKSDRRFYEIALKRVGKKPDEILYFDDVRENIEIAKSLGINAVLFKGLEDFKQQFPFLLDKASSSLNK